jgi:hypothetical protein
MSFTDVDSFYKKWSWTSFISTSIYYLQISSIVIYDWTIWDFDHVECANNILCGCSLFWPKFHLPLLSFFHSMLYSALPPYSFIDLLSFTYFFNLYSITLSFTFSFTWTSWIILGQNLLPLKMASSSHYFLASSYCCCNRTLCWHS